MTVELTFEKFQRKQARRKWLGGTIDISQKSISMVPFLKSHDISQKSVRSTISTVHLVQGCEDS